jgi:bacillithiol biosynthesis cysteine-adding enzyme BshC
MRTSHIPFEKIQSLSFKDVTYQAQPEWISSFIRFTPDLEGLKKAVVARKDFSADRSLLVSVLEEQYRNLDETTLVNQQIALLGNENTYTVITAHQPSLFGGPAYYFYKICSAINLVETLKKEMPQYHFIPVFINGGEDHDFDEVKSLKLFGKTLAWETDQKGSVGRFRTEGLEEVFQELSVILGENDTASGLRGIFQTSLQLAESYNDFVLRWAHALFGKYGLVVANMDNPRLKKTFIPYMERELLHRESERLVLETQERLQQFHFKPQAFPRDINLFYMMDGIRERIVFEDETFKVQHTDLSFTENEIIEHLHAFPERFSPNVVMRPVYQESVFPNIAYVGGGGEIAYWLERKKQFEHLGVFFPALIRRNSVMCISRAMQKNMDKLGITEEDILLDEEKLIIRHIEKHANTDFHLNEENQIISALFFKLSGKAKSIDPSLENLVLSEGHKVEKALDAIEIRLKRSLKQKEETNINQLKNLRAKFFPGNGLQERSESFLQQMVSEQAGLLDDFVNILNPLEKSFLFVYF